MTNKNAESARISPAVARYRKDRSSAETRVVMPEAKTLRSHASATTCRARWLRKKRVSGALRATYRSQFGRRRDASQRRQQENLS